MRCRGIGIRRTSSHLQNGADELTPPGQAILVRGVETLMSPYLPDDERAERLADLRQGQIELTWPEKQVLNEVKNITEQGKKATVRAVHEQLADQMGYNKVVALMSSLRQRGLLAGNSGPTREGEDD